MMNRLPTLYHKAKAGDLRQWSVWPEGSFIVTEYGSVGGKLQQSRKQAEAKNTGRSNATTAEQQAIKEVEALWRYKRERKYFESAADAETSLMLPMAAHKYAGSKRKKFKYPAWVQWKLDGVRALAYRDGEGVLQLTSRTGKPWHIPHIKEQLDNWMPKDMVLDGEIYTNDQDLQQITSWAKSADPAGKSFKPDSSLLQYYVYDMPVVSGARDLPWTDRLDALQSYLVDTYPVVRVPGEHVKDEKEMMENYERCVRAGYEGAMLRSYEGKYLWGYRSADLLKVKEFDDAEFLVTGVREGVGRMEGCAIWTCENDAGGDSFECVNKTSMANRQLMFEESEKYIGKFLTVKFFGRTTCGIPRFPVGLTFRAEEDLPKE